MEMKKASIPGQESGHLNAALSSDCMGQPNEIVQFGVVCAAIRSTFAAFHLKIHGPARPRRAKLSLTNQCLPWHPKAA